MSVEVLTRQVLVSGRVTDAITRGRPRTSPRLSVVRDSDDRALNGVAVRVQADGTYAIYGDPAFVLPPQSIDVRIEVRTEGYEDQVAVQSYTPQQLTRVTRALDLDGETVTVEVIGAPVRVQDIEITPLPVFLKGRITRIEDPAVPIAGASVTITAPAMVGPAVTDADGYYTLGPTPVATTITLAISAAGRTTATPTIRLDLRSPVNQGAFALEPA
jgi:hypothetical protein